MSWFSSIFSSGIDKVVDSVSNGLDKLFTSDEEKLILANKKLEIENQVKLAMEQFLLDNEKEITERWKSDNEHIITRLVRPLSYAWVVVLFSVVMIGDNALGLHVKDAYIPVLETLLTTMTVAYFGSRGIEKGIKHFKGNMNG